VYSPQEHPISLSDPISFALQTEFKTLPEKVVSDAMRGLTDTLGVAIAASTTDLSRIIRDHAAGHFAAGSEISSLLWQDGRRVSPAGAALANGMTTDALDAHDGSKPTKGHVGCGVVAATLALSETCSGAELLTRIAIGYEIGTRAGIALHATACDYHTSGSWIAIACAAIGARAQKLDPVRTREAMGIAEFHGPRSQMMRCIDHPTMVKDGSGWGAMAGVSAAFLAKDGFTGAPAVTIEGEDVAHVWADLGQRWYIREQYIKLYPVCRWAQPAVEAVLHVMQANDLGAHEVAGITVDTFHEASRLSAIPTTTEQAQYSLPFSVAAAVWRGTIGVADVGRQGLGDPDIIALARNVKMTAQPAFDAEFPARRLAVVHLATRDGRRLTSPVTEAKGDPEDPVSSQVIAEKFDRIARPVIGSTRTRSLQTALANLSEMPDCRELVAMMARPGT